MEKNIQLCGQGNGLVDVQYKISEEELKRLNIPKGRMCLVDSKEQVSVLKSLSNKEFNKCSGGSAANTIIAFSQFGGSAVYSCLLGDDEFGKFYAREFDELGIILNTKYIDPDLTGTCLVLITPDGERTMLTSLGATAKFAPENVNEELIQRSEWLYIEGYALSQRCSADAALIAVEFAKKHNTKVALTFSDGFIIDNYRTDLEQIASQSDLIFCNESEAIVYTSKPDFDNAFGDLSKNYTNFVVTQGEHGSKVKWNNEIYKIPSFPATALDATGAGDMYAAGFLYGLIVRKSPAQGGQLGSYASSLVVSQYGARLSVDHKKIRDEIFSF
ncbi:MAG: PfkB protein [Ignavibacteria bacterium]|nr:PfkB protein [Ignavibacteria bacterium]